MRQLKINKSITDKSDSSLDKYLHEISKEELISPDEEARLAQRIKQGDEVALEKLTKANLRFVVSVAKQYQHQGLSLPDLINEGNLGLIKAAKRFDETRGFKFISYAVRRIRQSILQALAETGSVVRLPVNQIGTLNRIHKTINMVEQKLERNPMAEELAEVLEIPEERVKSLLPIGPHTSLDSPIHDGEKSTTHIENLVGNKVAREDKVKEEIAISLSRLDRRESEVLKMFFGMEGDKMTIEEIAKELDLESSQIRRIKIKAIEKLKKERGKNLKQFIIRSILIKKDIINNI